MRVLHVISDRNIGGAGVLLTSLLKRLDRTRVESVVALPRSSLLEPRVKALGVPVLHLDQSCDRYNRRSVREIKAMIEEEDIDIVHANAAICARIAGKLCGTVVLHTRHCCFPPQGAWKSRIFSKIGGRVNAMLSDRVIATAEAAVENLCLLGVPRSSIEVIINGSEPIREVSRMELDQLRKKLNLTEDDFCIGICARLEECKGHDIFLHAAKAVLEQKKDLSFRFLIVGTGSQDETLKKLAEELGISEHVRFVGFVEDMAPIYHLLRINVNCSRATETSCLSLSEGMSAGVPFIASDFGGNVAMVGESEAGILFPVDDADALANAIIRVASNPSLEKNMKAAARARYEEKYTAEQMGKHLTAVYERLYRAKCEAQASRL